VPHCPKCHSTSLRRSPTRNRWERWRKEITGKRPYRCRACQWRGWKRIGTSEELQSPQARPDAPDPPNLKGTLLARSDPRLQLDLKELDRFHTGSKDDA
jgi:hypothetical protein